MFRIIPRRALLALTLSLVVAVVGFLAFRGGGSESSRTVHRVEPDEHHTALVDTLAGPLTSVGELMGQVTALQDRAPERAGAPDLPGQRAAAPASSLDNERIQALVQMYLEMLRANGASADAGAAFDPSGDVPLDLDDLLRRLGGSPGANDLYGNAGDDPTPPATSFEGYHRDFERSLHQHFEGFERSPKR